MEQWLSTWAAAVPELQLLAWNMVAATAILLVGWWVSSKAGHAMLRLARRPGSRIDPNIVPMAHSVAVWAIRIVVVVAVLARLGVQTASIIAVLGAAGLAVGLALQGTLQNIAAGIMLLALRPLRAGESVSVVGKGDGTVIEVGLFLTRLVQSDGIHLTLPNSLVWGNPIINYSRNEARRLDIEVVVRHGDDLERALSELNRLLSEHAHILPTPASQVMVTDYRETGVVLTVRAWAPVAQYWATVYDLRREALQVLAQAGLKPPIPVREVQTRVVDGAAGGEHNSAA